MKLAITLSILLGASSLFATSLVQKAKDSGLEAIPAQKAQLMKLIDDPKVHISEYSDRNAGVQPDTFAMRFSRV
ncbi:hypothetical protein [Aliarcobacter butzleri]|uniref:hypothetical protein n=1 Tax=Aliarcobacter butzleri TaxID=28197 RepID=UPI002B24A0C1|nr:hypothetical protein [Aliarcobacter butzleri]